MNYSISLPAKTEIIYLNKLSLKELEELKEGALEFENYELCHSLQYHINKISENI